MRAGTFNLRERSRTLLFGVLLATGLCTLLGAGEGSIISRGSGNTASITGGSAST